MKRTIAVIAACVVVSVTASTAAVAITGDIGSAGASSATTSTYGPLPQRQLQTLYSIDASLKSINHTLSSRAPYTVMGELKAINGKLGGGGVVGSGGSSVLDFLWTIAHK